ncbi:MAG: hypothetical protein IIC75_09285 [Bacteroidetes bacterium]|nr:hypothetical protein [Bacteroidota bacterium]
MKMCKKKQFKYCASEIDECMKRIIIMLNLYLKKGYETVACCCGHGKYDQSIMIKDKKGTIFDLVSNSIIPRKRNFYRRDKQGYYYIPEVRK